MASAVRKGFSANLGMLFKERGSLLKRLPFARKAGFDTVEISTSELFDYSPTEVAMVLHGEGLDCALFNMPAGDWPAGDRGLAALPHRQKEFDRSVEVAQEYAASLKCSKVHCLAGIAKLDTASQDSYERNLATAAHALGANGVHVLIEPINQRSIPGYHLSSMVRAADIVAAFDAKSHCGASGSLSLLFDVFHCQIMHGDISTNLRKYQDIIGHIQIAGVPDRAEPDNMQEINFPYLFNLLREELKYAGHIGCEYHPRGATEAGLSWMHAVQAVGSE